MRTDLRFSYRIDKNDESNFGGGFSRTKMDVYGIGPLNDFDLTADNSDVSFDYKGKYVNARVYYDRLGDTTAGGTPYGASHAAEISGAGDLSGHERDLARALGTRLAGIARKLGA